MGERTAGIDGDTYFFAKKYVSPFPRAQDSADFLRRVEAFLARHNPGRDTGHAGRPSGRVSPRARPLGGFSFKRLRGRGASAKLAG